LKNSATEKVETRSDDVRSYRDEEKKNVLPVTLPLSFLRRVFYLGAETTVLSLSLLLVSLALQDDTGTISASESRCGGEKREENGSATASLCPVESRRRRQRPCFFFFIWLSSSSARSR